MIVEPGPRARSSGGRVVYAIGPIEGRYDLLTEALTTIVADIAARTDDAPPLLVFTGNHLGERSAEVLSALVWLSRQPALEICAIRGEREAALLVHMAGEDGGSWADTQDAVATRRSYGAEAGDLTDIMPASHVELLRAMPETATCGDYAFGWRRGEGRGARTTVFGDGSIITPAAIGLRGDGALTVVRLENGTAAFLRDLPASGPIPSDEPDDAGTDENRSLTMRGALTRLRPGY